MRKLIGFVFCVICLASCDKINHNNTDHNTGFFDIDKYMYIAGIEHNRGLDYVFSKLSERNAQLLDLQKHEIDYPLLTMQYVEEFLTNSGNMIIVDHLETALSTANMFYEKFLSEMPYKSNSSLINIWEFINNESLSQKQFELLSVLDNVLTNEDCLKKTLDVFEQVRNRVKNECQDDEKTVVLAAIEIGVNSLNYWNENIDNWIALFNDGEKSWFSWRQVAAFDVAGAVGGAVATAITGGGVAAGIIGGAVAASAVSATVQIICHYGNC